MMKGNALPKDKLLYTLLDVISGVKQGAYKGLTVSLNLYMKLLRPLQVASVDLRIDIASNTY